MVQSLQPKGKFESTCGLVFFTFIRFVSVKCQFSRAIFSSSAFQPPFKTTPPDHWATLSNLQSSPLRNYFSPIFRQRTSILCLGKRRLYPIRVLIYTPVRRGADAGRIFCSIKSDGPGRIRTRVRSIPSSES